MDNPDGCRLDRYLVEQHIAASRERAKELIASGAVCVNARVTVKPAVIVRAGDAVDCHAEPPRYVGRGGYKLEKMLESVSPKGCVCMDVGASTGGFTDCLLQHGAAHVYAVDVGRDQLNPTLKEDARVTSLEGMDVRSPQLHSLVPPCCIGFASVDVSFISLSHVLPALLPFLQPSATVICLIKPQFEAGRQSVGKRGIVRDPAVHRRVLEEMLALFQSLALSVCQFTYSPITGGEGNIEYLAVLRYEEGTSVAVQVPQIVKRAFETLHKTGQ